MIDIYLAQSCLDYFTHGTSFFSGSSDLSVGHLECVAYQSPEHGRIILFKGTDDWEDWRINFDSKINPEGFHTGWWRATELLSERVKSWVRRGGSTTPLSLSGHSAGGSLALLVAYRLAIGITRRTRTENVVTFGTPKVMSKGRLWVFRSALPQGSVREYINPYDLVPKFPFDPRYAESESRVHLEGKSQCPLKAHKLDTYLSLMEE